MKIKRALTNPIGQSQTQPTTEQKVLERMQPVVNESINAEQLTLVNESREFKVRQFLMSLKVRMMQRRDFMVVSQIWKTPAVPFFIVTSVVNLLILIVITVFFYDKFGPEIPFFYDSINLVRDMSPKFMLFILPIIVLGFFAIQIQLIPEIFKKDRKLGLANAWILTFLNILFMISLSRVMQI